MIDFIENAINKRYHLTDVKQLSEQQWSMVVSHAEKSPVYIWGLGQGINLIFDRCKYLGIKIDGVVDNDIHKQGMFISDFYEVPEEYADLPIMSKKEFELYEATNRIVIICSIRYYEQIYKELSAISGVEAYSFLHMEINSSDKLDDCYVKKNLQYVTQIKNNKIFVIAMGASYCNHEKYITEKLCEINDELEIVWCVDKIDIPVPEQVRLVYSGNTDKMLKELSNSKIIITSTFFPDAFKKSSGQILIHLKHWGSITLKKFYLDAPSVSDVSENAAKWKDRFDQLDYIFVGSKFDEDSCRRGFSNIPEMIYTGSARSDVLFSPDDAWKKVRKYYGIFDRKKLLLYAPTYRFVDISVDEAYKVQDALIDFHGVIDSLHHRFGGEWTILLRLHPGIRNLGEDIAKAADGDVIDVSMYDDSQELIAASDMMITDYSSIMFEPAYVGKPVILFAPDRKTYIDKEYELLLNYDDLPFPIVESNDELEEAIIHFEVEQYQRGVDDFLCKYDVHEDGRASERAAKFILGLLEE